MSLKFSQGVYHIKNPEKYIGHGSPRYRSSWEFTFMMFCDNNPSVQQWASESIKIPYRDPLTGKPTVYVPDFLISYIDKTISEGSTRYYWVRSKNNYGYSSYYPYDISGIIGRNNLLLDIYQNNVGGAYSLRKLRKLYIGYALRVRRSLDNTTLDIGFDVNGDLDSTTLLNFVGSYNGYVNIWYDQSINQKDGIQDNIYNQPQIVSNGQIINLGSKPSLLYDNTGYDYLAFGDISNIRTVFATIRPSSNSYMFILGGNNNCSYQPGTNTWLSNTSLSDVLYNNRLNNVLTDLTQSQRENKYYLLSMLHTNNAYASTISIKLLDTSNNYIGLLSAFNVNAYDINNNQLTDFANYPISVQATLPNTNSSNTLNIYKLYGNSLMNPQPDNYPRQLTFQGNYIWTATLPSLSNFVILDDTYNN